MGLNCHQPAAEEILYGQAEKVYPQGVRTAPDYISLSVSERDLLHNAAAYLQAFSEEAGDPRQMIAEELAVLIKAERIGHSSIINDCLDRAAAELTEIGAEAVAHSPNKGNVFDPMITDLHELSALVSSLPSA